MRNAFLRLRRWNFGRLYFRDFGNHLYSNDTRHERERKQVYCIYRNWYYIICKAPKLMNKGEIVMKFKVFNEDKLQLLGQDAVAVTVRYLMETKKLEEFSHGLSRIDYKEDLKKEIQFGKEFESVEHHEQVLFYMVMYCATLMKYNAIDYIKDRKLFGGYKEAPFKAHSFSLGLKAGLENFKRRGNFIHIKSINANKSLNGYDYSYGEPLSNIPLPFFWFELSKQSLDEITVEFATKIASIREPINPDIVIAVFYEKAKELVPLTHEIMIHFFVD